MKTAIKKTDVLIVGAGVAGASLAIRLRARGIGVTVVEKDKFPRQKLCGEFVSPECQSHFEELGVLDSMLDIGGDSIHETRFFSENGQQLSVPSKWFSDGDNGALGISRAEMDYRLLERARDLGATVYEECRAVDMKTHGARVSNVTFKTVAGEKFEVEADMVVDATGRPRVLGKLAENGKSKAPRKRKIKHIAFKVHYENVALEKGVCEIYFFRGGYGGLNYVENGRVNHCFLIDSKVAREFNGDADRIVENVAIKNERVAIALKHAEKTFDWLAVPVEKFGRQRPNGIENLISLGDAAAFIDPFTGSGMLMALESSGILATAFADYGIAHTKRIKAAFENAHIKATRRRLNVCSVFRHLSFSPALAGFAISSASLSSSLLKRIASLTRPAGSH